jgi:hypothetical protein
MSLINDALKQARKAPPRNLPAALPPLRPAADHSSLVPPWLWPSVAILLVVAAIFFIGWTAAHRSVQAGVTTPLPASAPVVTLPPPAPKPPAAEPPPPLNPPAAPKLQGIFYSPTAPSAIVDGKSVHLGDPVGEYHVKAISKFTVTLIGPDKKEIQIGLGN